MRFQLLLLFGLLALVVADDTVSESDEANVEETNGPLVKQFARRPTKKNSNQLYNDVVNENYDHAITLAQDYINRGQGSVVKAAVNKLVQNSKETVTSFAYKLYAAGQKSIVEQYFPAAFKMVFPESSVKFTNLQYNQPIDFDMSFRDSDGDYVAQSTLESANSNNYAFKLEPVTEGNKVYFKIRNFSHNVYLKLGTNIDSYLDSRAYGSTINDHPRHQWMFMPVNHRGRLLFFIINRDKQQELKLGNGVHGGHRYIYGTLGRNRNVNRYGWQVAAITD